MASVCQTGDAAFDDEVPLSFRVSRTDFGRIVPGRSQLEVTTRQGWLDIEWIESQRVPP